MRPPKNIIFIGVDTLRYDCISCEKDRHSLDRYGAADRVDTPEIDRFAGQGVRFSQAITVTPYTSASFASIFTGLYPPRHNVRATYYTKMAPTVTTLAERLKGAGYETFQILDLDNQLNPTGVTRGIDHRFLTTPNNNETDALCRALVENRERKMFLFAYFLDVSNPYGFSHVEPWRGYNDDYFRSMEGLKKRFTQGKETAGDRPDKYYTWGKIKHAMFSGAYKDEVVKMYIDGVNKFSRGRFAWFMRRLEGLGLLEDTLLVITADHGEADYGFDFTHGGDLTEDVIRVPLIMSYPGALPEGRVVDAQVSQVDITPTVLELAGIRCDGAFDGQSLVPAIKGLESPARVAYGEVWGYEWEKVRKFMFAEGLLKKEKPEYDVFLRQRFVRTPRFKYVLCGESHEETVDDFNKEILVKWACRNHYFRHENDEEMKCWWEKLYSGEISEGGLIEGILATPDAKERHGLFDLMGDPFEKRNLLLGEKDDAHLCEAIELQDQLLGISRTEVPTQSFLRTVYSNIERNDREKERSAERLASKPVRMLTDLTNRCNIRCRICYRNYAKRTDTDFKLEWFRDLMPLFSTLKELQLSSVGEPFAYKQIDDVLELLEQYPHLFTVAVSNGTLLGRSGLAERISRSIKRLGISFDGATRETYESVRRGASYDRVIGNIAALNRLKKECGSPYPEIVFHFVPLYSNIRELPKLIELADSLDIRFITAKHLGIVNEEMEQALEAECMFYHQELYNAVLEESEKRAEHLGVDLNFPPPYAVSGNGGGCDCDAKRGSIECFEPWESVYIYADGNVCACCGSMEVFGNLGETAFEEIWEGRKYGKLRATVNSESPLPMCRNCSSAGARGRISKQDEIQSYYRYAKTRERKMEEEGVPGGDGGSAEGCGGSVPGLNTAVWFLTWKCNNQCPYCWEVQRQSRGECTPEEFAAADTWIEAWNRIRPGTLDITGGEPWLQPGFIDLLEGLDDRIRIAITTNATRDLTEFVQRIRPEKVCSMTLSLHPTQRMSTDTFIGKCHLLKNRGFPITVNFVAWPEQMWLIPMYKELFEKHGVRFHVDPYAATPYRLYEFSTPEKEFLRQYVAEDRSYWFGEVEKVPVLCSGGYDHLNVQPNGDAFRCIRDRITDGDRVGNILERDFSLYEDWTYCEDYHRCPGCDRDKVTVRRLEDARGVERSEPLSYNL